MNNYNIKNYVRYKEDLKSLLVTQPGLMWDEYSRDQLIIKNLPMVEKIARSFTLTQQATGVLNLNDLIQEGSKGLIAGVDKINWELLYKNSDNIEITLKSFLGKRIKGAIRRAIDINRGNIKIPEHKLIKIRKDNGEDEQMVALFFNSIFLSLDKKLNNDTEEKFDVPDTGKAYNIDILNAYLISLIDYHLNDTEALVLKLFYGLNSNPMPAKEIAKKIGLKSKTSNVKVSEIKRKAIDKLIKNVSPEKVIDYLS
jgi:RNA polymerase sigma factor (sigma-70 family)